MTESVAHADIINIMNTVKHDYHTVSETGSSGSAAITRREVKPSAGRIWNAIRTALRWPLRIIGIIMFIIGAYVFYIVSLAYTVNHIILWQVIGCSVLFIIAGFIAFMLAGRKKGRKKNKNHAGKSYITAGDVIEFACGLASGIVDLIRNIM